MCFVHQHLVPQCLSLSHIEKSWHGCYFDQSLQQPMHSDLKFNWEKLVDQHEAMVEAIKKQDSVKAEKLMRAHLTLLQYDQVALKVEYPEYFN